MPELSRDYTVTTEGAIEVPFLGQINVLKKTSRDVATLVANGLRGDFLSIRK
jgi:protein involved in polysaccharide export with SLBB domain